MIRRAFRPRVLVYTGILLLITVAVMVSLYLRTPLKVDVIRDRGALARMVEKGRIENVFRLQVMNATEHTQRYRISVSGLPDSRARRAARSAAWRAGPEKSVVVRIGPQAFMLRSPCCGSLGPVARPRGRRRLRRG